MNEFVYFVLKNQMIHKKKSKCLPKVICLHKIKQDTLPPNSSDSHKTERQPDEILN